MNETLRKVIEYRELKAKRDLLRVALSPTESDRIHALERALGSRPFVRFKSFADPQDRRHFDRFGVRMLATVDITGLKEHVFIHNVSAGGVQISVIPGLSRGDLVVLSIPDGDRDVLRLPAQAVWRSDDAADLSFVGIPARG